MNSDRYVSNIMLQLESLDEREWTKVKYDPINFTLSFIQRGRMIDARAMRGLVKVKHSQALLSPAGLRELRDNLRFCMQYPDVAFMVPIDLGYKVYGRDTSIHDRPILLTEIKFYSIKNWLYLKIIKWSNKRLRLLLRDRKSVV